MEDEVLAFVRERGEVAFPEINAAFDADTGAVFRACRRLARSGEVHAVLPLVYRPGDEPASDGTGAGDAPRTPVNAVERLESGGEPRDGGVQVAADADAADVADAADADDGDDGGFEWVGGA